MTKTMIAIPCMDQVPVAFVKSLVSLRYVGDVEVVFASGSLVYDARNQLASRAVSGRFDRVLWLDSDMIFGPDIMERIMARLDEGYEVVSGLYFKRKLPIEPVIYKRCDVITANGKQVPVAEPFRDYPKDSFFNVAACGFGCVATKTEILDRISKSYGMPFWPVAGFGEDLSFCLRAKALNVPIMCDSSIKLGHVGITAVTETAYEIAARKD